MTDDDTNSAVDDATRVSDGLRNAFAELAAADLELEVRSRYQRRLIAITNMSKHDVARARMQLDTFYDEWNAARRTR